ncbi:MAG: DNA topoisomerase IV [Pirellulaceae bacterium]|nr:DNA topoisomerase IV [Pirellulaceae bacterium]
MNFYPRPIKLHDCSQSGIGSGAELFLVEGDSASKAVARVRNQQHQAVLPMQGKPMNAIKASEKSITNNGLFQALVQCLGTGWADALDLSQLRYDRIILLFDPDADGIHCGALMTMFFHRWMPSLLQSGRLFVVRPPLYEIRSQQYSDVIHALNDDHYRRICSALDAKKIRFQTQRFRGLASLGAKTLSATCLCNETRHIQPLRMEDAEAAIRIFGGKQSA